MVGGQAAKDVKAMKELARLLPGSPGAEPLGKDFRLRWKCSLSWAAGHDLRRTHRSIMSGQG